MVAINATLHARLPFVFLDDLVPVAGIVRVANVMTVTKNFPARTVAEFIDHGKKNPDQINMASPGAGTSVNREFNTALADPAMRARLADLGGVPIAGTPEEFWALHRMETEKWARIVQFSGWPQPPPLTQSPHRNGELWYIASGRGAR